MEQSKYSFSVVNISADQNPTSQINKRGGYVEYGEGNKYMEYCLQLFMESGIHHALIEGKTMQVYGNGMAVRSSSQVGGLAKLNGMFKPKEQYKCLLDKYIHNNYAIKIVTNGAGLITKMTHWPVQTLRPEIADENGVVNNYYYSKDWADIRKNKPEPIKAWIDDDSKKKGEYIYFVNAYNPSNQYFGAPEYVGAIKYVEMDIEIATYHLSNIQNGFSAATIFQFNNGIPTPQERMEIENGIKQKFTGTKGKKFLITYNDDPAKKAEIFSAPIPEADKQYEFLAKHVTEQIIIGHKITSPMLVGVRTATGLGNNADEIRTAQELFFNVVIHPEQKDFIEELQPLLKGAKISGNFYLRPFEVLSEKEPEVVATRFEKFRAIKLEENNQSPFKVLTQEHGDWLFDQLKDCGEDESELLGNGFHCVHSEDLSGDDNLQVSEESSTELMSAWGINADNLSKYDVKKADGSGVWLVRYQYALAKQLEGQPDLIDTSRNFCINMIDIAKNGNRVYKRETLENLVNKDFGNYEIFWYKGSYNCRHVWRRKLYFKAKDGDVNNVGNVPYVVAQLDDKMATTMNLPPKR